MRSKTLLAADLLRKRLEHGDHRLRKLPGERRLAEELGLSRNTVRAALEQLVRDGLLTRKRNGRLAVARVSKAGTRACTIGFMAPSVFSRDHRLWFEGVVAAVDGLEAKLRPLTYAHWGDPVIHQALNGLDGLFFVSQDDSLPAWLVRKIREASCRTVMLDADVSAAKLPSILLFPPPSLEKLLTHLQESGHQRIDCLNTQTENAVIKERIDIWRRFLHRHGLSGKLRSVSIRRPIEAAYATVRKALSGRRAMAAAQFCTTGPAAIGAMRAFHEAGLEIGRDVSVCAVNDEGMAPFLLRTMTALVSPPRVKYLRSAAEWMLGGDDWSGPLRVQPQDAPLFIGESTGPAPENGWARAQGARSIRAGKAKS